MGNEVQSDSGGAELHSSDGVYVEADEKAAVEVVPEVEDPPDPK